MPQLRRRVGACVRVSPCAIIAAILRYGRPLNLNARVDLDHWVVLSVFDGGLAGGVPPLNGTEIDPGHVKPRAGARALPLRIGAHVPPCPARERRSDRATSSGYEHLWPRACRTAVEVLRP